MATRKIDPAPRTVYTSPCGRATVERHGRRDFLALLDGQPLDYHPFAFQAEAAAHKALGAALEREGAQVEDDEPLILSAGALTLTIDPLDPAGPVALDNGTTLITVSPADLRALVAQMAA